jgi:hypothetical protein
MSRPSRRHDHAGDKATGGRLYVDVWPLHHGLEACLAVDTMLAVVNLSSYSRLGHRTESQEAARQAPVGCVDLILFV